MTKAPRPECTESPSYDSDSDINLILNYRMVTFRDATGFELLRYEVHWSVVEAKVQFYVS